MSLAILMGDARIKFLHALHVQALLIAYEPDVRNVKLLANGFEDLGEGYMVHTVHHARVEDAPLEQVEKDPQTRPVFAGGGRIEPETAIGVLLQHAPGFPVDVKRGEVEHIIAYASHRGYGGGDALRAEMREDLLRLGLHA